MRLQAAVLDKQDGPFQLQGVELDEPGAGEVLVRIAATCICHTDGLARHGDLPFPAPGMLGHEGSGVVIAVRPDVTSVREGDHVVIGWPWCGECPNCLAGEPRYCARLGELPVSLVKVPHDVPLDLLGPLACGLSTGAGAVLHTLRPQTGSSLVVYGTGSLSLAAVMASRNSGATTIIAVDRHTSWPEPAKELGATHTVNAADADPVTAVHDICGRPADNTQECTGIISVVRQAADSVGMLGTCAVIRGAPAGAEFALDRLTTLWGKRIVGVLGGGGRSTQLIGALIEWYRQGRFPPERLDSWVDFDQIDQALQASQAGDVIKPIVRMPS